MITTLRSKRTLHRVKFSAEMGNHEKACSAKWRVEWGGMPAKSDLSRPQSPRPHRLRAGYRESQSSGLIAENLGWGIREWEGCEERVHVLEQGCTGGKAGPTQSIYSWRHLKVRDNEQDQSPCLWAPPKPAQDLPSVGGGDGICSQVVCKVVTPQVDIQRTLLLQRLQSAPWIGRPLLSVCWAAAPASSKARDPLLWAHSVPPAQRQNGEVGPESVDVGACVEMGCFSAKSGEGSLQTCVWLFVFTLH